MPNEKKTNQNEQSIDGSKSTVPEDGNKEYLITSISSSSNTSSKQMKKLEEKLENLESFINELNEGIEERRNSLKSSGKIDQNGNRIKLPEVTKLKLLNQISNLKSAKKEMKVEVSKISKLLSTLYRTNNQRIARSILRTSARTKRYHQKHKKDIEDAIVKFTFKLKPDALENLKKTIETKEPKKVDGTIMKTILKLDHKLHTRIVSNSDARNGYLQFFKNIIFRGNNSDTEEEPIPTT